jgi:hypothetical protein
MFILAFVSLLATFACVVLTSVYVARTKSLHGAVLEYGSLRNSDSGSGLLTGAVVMIMIFVVSDIAIILLALFYNPFISLAVVLVFVCMKQAILSTFCLWSCGQSYLGPIDWGGVWVHQFMMSLCLLILWFG